MNDQQTAFVVSVRTCTRNSLNRKSLILGESTVLLAREARKRRRKGRRRRIRSDLKGSGPSIKKKLKKIFWLSYSRL